MNVVHFIDAHVQVNELGKAFALFPHQREVLSQALLEGAVPGRVADIHAFLAVP